MILSVCIFETDQPKSCNQSMLLFEASLYIQIQKASKLKMDCRTLSKNIKLILLLLNQCRLLVKMGFKFTQLI